MFLARGKQYNYTIFDVAFVWTSFDIDLGVNWKWEKKLIINCWEWRPVFMIEYSYYMHN